MTGPVNRKSEGKTERFYCPYPGCKRSFIDLWRLKVHYRADPDVRGSGRERGHGKELPACPKCRKRLERGRHHVNCAAGKAAPSQANRRTQRVPRECIEANSFPETSTNFFEAQPIKSEVAWNCFLPPNRFQNGVAPLASFGSVGTVEFPDSFFSQSVATNRVESDRESLTAFPFPNVCGPGPNWVPDINVTPGYAVVLRSNSNARPSVYFVPGETVEVSVQDPAVFQSGLNTM